MDFFVFCLLILNSGFNRRSIVGLVGLGSVFVGISGLDFGARFGMIVWNVFGILLCGC